MILTLDVGNTQMSGALHNEQGVCLQFRKTSKEKASSDEFGLFLRQVITENGYNPKEVRHIALCSVVPSLIHSLKSCCKKYFNVRPFILQAGVKTGLKIKYRNPLEVGADRIANAIGALQKYPETNLIIVDFGTATTFCAITCDRSYLGGIILPGLKLSMDALTKGTAKLPSVEITQPKDLIGRSTVESIQSGLYFGQLTLIKEVSRQVKEQYFQGSCDQKTLVIGTGGFARLFESAQVFDVVLPELVHLGLFEALKLNA